MAKLPIPEVLQANQTAGRLTPLQDRFISELLLDQKISPGKALERAGSTAKNLAAAAGMMLSNPKVRAELEERRKDVREALGIDALAIAQKLKDLMESDIPDVFDANGFLLPLSKWPEAARSAVSSITFDNPVFGESELRPRIKTVKFIDKLKAIEMLTRLLDIQPPKRVDHTSGGEKIGSQTLVIGDMKIEF